MYLEYHKHDDDHNETSILSVLQLLFIPVEPLQVNDHTVTEFLLFVVLVHVAVPVVSDGPDTGASTVHLI